MSGYDLPTSAVINGRDFDIRSDYRAALDIMGVLSDLEITDEERVLVSLNVFYPRAVMFGRSDYEQAYKYMIWFLNGGVDNADSGPKPPKLMDWKQDFPLIVAPVNRVLNCEIRALEYLHWWTFLAAYREIGDCLFAQVVSIRKKKAKGAKLDKADAEFYRNNRDLVDFKVQLTSEEQAFLDEIKGVRR